MHRPDYSPEKRATALAWIRGNKVIDRPDLDEEARITAVIGCLICDDTGHINATELPSALIDPWLRETAQQLLIQARQEAE